MVTATRIVLLAKVSKRCVRVKLVGPQVSLQIGWVPAGSGRDHFFCVIRRHFHVCKDVASGSQLSGGGNFFSCNKEALACVQRCRWWVPPVSGRNYYFHVISRHLLACGHGPYGSLLSADPRTSLFRWQSFVDY